MKADFHIDDTGALSYTLNRPNFEVIAPSVLGIKLGNLSYLEFTGFGNPQFKQVNNAYSIKGKHKKAFNHYNSFEVFISNTVYKPFILECRAYNDGLAYRYRIPGTGMQTVLEEKSSWSIANNPVVWFMERDNAYKLKSYAGEWIKTTIDSLHIVSKEGPIQGNPLIVELEDNEGYLVITEAALYNYSGMRLKALEGGKVKVVFTEGENGFQVQDTIITPWRVSMIAENLNDLVNSDLISNLNPAPSSDLFKNTDYIKPGKSVWRWWHKNTGTSQQERKYIDYAHQLNFEYITIDEGWEDWPYKWDTVKSLTNFGSEKSVGIFLWKHSNQLNHSNNNFEKMRFWLDSVSTSGAVGVKVDFMNSETKELIDFEIALLKLAAERELMVNFHGSHPPTGESRTYPNEITREGIRGLELNRMAEGPIPAKHNAVLPFTRFAIGHGDYTPLGFTSPGATTWAHQLATLVAFDSPLQMIAEDPVFLLTSDKIASVLPILQNFPTIWSETVVLPQSKLGEMAVLAKKSGNYWYVGVLNGNSQKSIVLDLSFLSSISYEAILFEDDIEGIPVNLEGLNPLADIKSNLTAIPFTSSKSSVNKDSKLKITLAKNGGCLLVIKPVNE